LRRLTGSIPKGIQNHEENIIATCSGKGTLSIVRQPGQADVPRKARNDDNDPLQKLWTAIKLNGAIPRSIVVVNRCEAA
jgi:hypothetical protein